jgi:hypothetical protein
MRAGVVSLCWVGLFLSVCACGQDPAPQSPPLIIIEPEEDLATSPDQASAPDQAPDLATPDLEEAPDMALDMEQAPDLPAEPDMAPDMEAPDMAPDPCAGFPAPTLIKPNCGRAPLRVRFDATGALNSVDEVGDYYWELSDGSIATEVVFDATYTAPGEVVEVFYLLGLVGDTRVELRLRAPVRVLP